MGTTTYAIRPGTPKCSHGPLPFGTCSRCTARAIVARRRREAAEAKERVAEGTRLALIEIFR